MPLRMLRSVVLPPAATTETEFPPRLATYKFPAASNASDAGALMPPIIVRSTLIRAARTR